MSTHVFANQNPGWPNQTALEIKTEEAGGKTNRDTAAPEGKPKGPTFDPRQDIEKLADATIFGIERIFAWA
jgi:hypothetical protein